jgi:hypothetical protein
VGPERQYTGQLQKATDKNNERFIFQYAGRFQAPKTSMDKREETNDHLRSLSNPAMRTSKKDQDNYKITIRR